MMETPDKNLFKIAGVTTGEVSRDGPLYNLCNRFAVGQKYRVAISLLTAEELENLRFVLDCFFSDVGK